MCYEVPTLCDGPQTMWLGKVSISLSWYVVLLLMYGVWYLLSIWLNFESFCSYQISDLMYRCAPRIPEGRRKLASHPFHQPQRLTAWESWSLIRSLLMMVCYWVVCQVGEHQHQLAHQCSLCENFHTYGTGCDVKTWQHMGMGHLRLRWDGAVMA